MSEAGIEPKSEPRVNLGARVRASTRRRARMYAAEFEVEMQDVLDAALDEYLSARER